MGREPIFIFIFPINNGREENVEKSFTPEGDFLSPSPHHRERCANVAAGVCVGGEKWLLYDCTRIII